MSEDWTKHKTESFYTKSLVCTGFYFEKPSGSTYCAAAVWLMVKETPLRAPRLFGLKAGFGPLNSSLEQRWSQKKLAALQENIVPSFRRFYRQHYKTKFRLALGRR